VAVSGDDMLTYAGAVPLVTATPYTRTATAAVLLAPPTATAGATTSALLLVDALSVQGVSCATLGRTSTSVYVSWSALAGMNADPTSVVDSVASAHAAPPRVRPTHTHGSAQEVRTGKVRHRRRRRRPAEPAQDSAVLCPPRQHESPLTPHAHAECKCVATNAVLTTDRPVTQSMWPRFTCVLLRFLLRLG
jgi:hypothetical protein